MLNPEQVEETINDVEELRIAQLDNLMIVGLVHVLLPFVALTLRVNN